MTGEAHRPCPICAGLDREVLHRQSFAGDGALGGGYEVVVCTACGAGFADGIPTQAELERYYAERSKYEYAQNDGAESPYDFKRFELIADQLTPLLPSRSAAILDVGCATGGLLACLARRGYTQLLGSDPSPACAVAARRLHGIEVRPSTIGQLAAWERRFDVILAVGVLEHLRDVRAALATLVDRLNPGGLLYCAQPDVATFTACVNAPYQQFSTEHVNFFSVSSLNRLMAGCGLAPRRTWSWSVEWREEITDSVLSGLYERAPAVPEMAFDTVTRSALVRYLNVCREQDKRVVTMIAQLVRSQVPVMVWGTGTLTRRLLASGGLDAVNIVAFIDSNPVAQGQTLAGRRVMPPEWIADRGETIFVCSVAFEREIVRTIRERLGRTNPVLLPYA
jgi:SAM-dependent methyltransferase